MNLLNSHEKNLKQNIFVGNRKDAKAFNLCTVSKAQENQDFQQIFIIYFTNFIGDKILAP